VTTWMVMAAAGVLVALVCACAAMANGRVDVSERTPLWLVPPRDPDRERAELDVARPSPRAPEGEEGA
jgi:hypothetical protein